MVIEMSIMLKPQKRGFKILHYCLFCIVSGATLSLLTYFTLLNHSSLSGYLKNTESITSMVISIMLGPTLTIILLLPLIANLKSILKSFSADDKSFRKVSFPSELEMISEAIFDLKKSAQAANLELQRQDQGRRELLANAAHDIKGPLSSIYGYLEDCLRRSESGDLEATKQSLQICIKNAKLLERIVAEIFEAAKFDDLSGNLISEVINIDEFLGDIVIKFKSRADLEEKYLIFKPETQNSLVQIDLGLFERAISNLIDNALKYTPKGGQISVSSRIERDLILINVSDSGKGIAESDLPHIFDRLYRVERDRSKESKGSGFGLSIVKKIVEAHSGKIFCSSAPGAGSVFQITLPVFPREQIAAAMAELITRK